MCMKFEAGTHIRYGGNGICLIDRIEERTNTDTQQTNLYYVLKPIRGAGTSAGMTMFVPADSEQLCAKMQPLHSKEEIDALLEAASEEAPLPWEDDRKLRGADFRKIISGGEASALLRMIRCILHQQKVLSANNKRLSAMDDKFCKDAESMLDEEFAFSLGISHAEASRYIREKLRTEA